MTEPFQRPRSDGSRIIEVRVRFVPQEQDSFFTLPSEDAEKAAVDIEAAINKTQSDDTQAI